MFLGKLLKRANKQIVKRSPLCKSVAGNDLDLLIITNFESTEDEIAQRKAVILTARVHPGETNSSYIMQGLLEFIVSSDKQAKLLRNTYVFKIVPMLNPDGVIIGNYRCSLAGLDLNR
jgi:murein tripeptide amidase MpaA